MIVYAGLVAGLTIVGTILYLNHREKKPRSVWVDGELRRGVDWNDLRRRDRENWDALRASIEHDLRDLQGRTSSMGQIAKPHKAVGCWCSKTRAETR